MFAARNRRQRVAHLRHGGKTAASSRELGIKRGREGGDENGVNLICPIDSVALVSISPRKCS
jgi:hypothetical protein